MKKILSVLLLLSLLLAAMIPCAGLADGYDYSAPYLVSLTHNCTNTGKLLPEVFNPYVTSYILTVGYKVNRVQFTPVANDPNCTVTINGQYVAQGTKSEYIQMDNNPKQATIIVTAQDGSSRTYTIFLQRRPSELRTRVSAGYINDVYQKDNKWYIDADLVSVTYKGGNLSTFTNKAVEHYKYACTDECIIYIGDLNYAIRLRNMNEFKLQYDTSGMYRFVYIEDEIVAVLPYAADP